MNDFASKDKAKHKSRMVQSINHVCSTEGCESGAPYGFKEDEKVNIYRWCCSDHIAEGEIILSDGSKKIAVRGRR